MNPTELTTRLNKGEDLHTEFKERLIHADDLAASIIAFANTDGGQMIFGVNDSGQITGLGDESDIERIGACTTCGLHQDAGRRLAKNSCDCSNPPRAFIMTKHL
jgi:predicted HTH transcriptional regulator